ncbi:MAG: GNAT family N-acetyltransferase [Acidimicrobiales bacterium]
MASADDYELIEKDWREFTDEEIAERVALNNALIAELLPDDPPRQVDEAIKAHHSTPKRMKSWPLRIKDPKGQLVAGGGTGFDPEHDENPDMFWLGIGVLPSERRKGLATRLLGRLVEIAEAEGRTRLLGNSNDLKPEGRLFAQAIGAEAKQANHVNHLPVDAIDRAQLEGWIAAAPDRAADYELITWDGPCPEEHLEQFVDIILVMNTAPRDDIEMNDFTLTPAQLRESEERALAVDVEMWTVVVRRKSDGAFAGFHDVNWAPTDPATVWIGATGVKPEHRGHAIGKWLKAAMTLRVLGDRPEVTSIRTGNADSNDAMLGINKEMGYRPLLAQTTWEISVADAQKWLATRA